MAVIRVVAVCAALLFPLGTAVASADPGPAVDPTGTVQLSPTTGGTESTEVVPETGSADAVVFEQFPAAQAPPAQLMVQSTNGSPTDLGSVPREAPSFWLVGDTLSASNGPDLRHVDWWRESGTGSGTVALPSGDAYQSGAPGGFVYLRSERLFRRTVSGGTFELGRPFVGAHPTAIADGQDMLALSGSRAKYLVFGHPDDFHPLDTGGHTLTCTSIASGYAACFDQGGEPVLLPLDGRRAMVMSDVPGRVGQAVSGSTLIAIGSDGYLYSETYGSDTMRRSTSSYDGSGNHYPRAPALTSAFGDAAVADNADHHLDAVSSASAPPRLLATAPTAPPVTQDFSVSAGQIVYSDDRAAPGVPPAPASSFRRTLTTSSAHLVAGAESVLAHADPGLVLASGTTTVLATASGSSGYTLSIRSPRGTTTISDAWAPSLSGNRMVYATRDASSTYSYHLFDAVTGAITDPRGDGPPIAGGWALDGDHLAYGTADDAVEYENLATGATATVLPGTDEACGGADVYLAGDYVAWNREVYVPADEGCEPEAAFRSVATGSAVQSLGNDDLVDVSASGPLVIEPNGNSPYMLYTSDGPLDVLPSADVKYPSPAVSGRTVAWIDRSGTLQAAPAAITPPAPRFLGDPLPLPPTAATPLHEYVPYSQPLVSCSVAITDGADHQVATLPCTNAAARLGVAQFSWDGRSGGSPAPAGTYTYTITAAGDGGPAQSPDGTATPVAGTFTIG